ncbi:putative bifunctional diguanylate cyclase/phosphodiesterase [Pararoseomonas indoligenes]|uniref:EAL domain-containing protein n=1 Tax=Roseomonas indoligenes TaxID=2820811 RepID=A0A940MWF9_9PROT|nr:EAL domain-containing protein [Pararoseomonas indoligenes]MBP0492255.1 EAL domain-containing protein [Pararoseomonas indoligenes]
MDSMIGAVRPAAGAGRCQSCAGPLWQGDELTKLADRREFLARLSDALTVSAQSNHDGGERRVAVMMIDLDRFKAVNDGLGHPAGDALLRKVAARLRSALRETDMPARLGGDEFAVLLDKPVDECVVEAIATRLVDLISRPYMIDGSVANIGASIGIAFAAPGTGPDDLLGQADLALYKSKAEGRGRFAFFEPALQEAARARRALEFDLRAALALGQFELFYQPKIHLGENCLSGFEALIRWRHPLRGLVRPDDFIPMAEDLGLIIRIGEWVLRAACSEAVNWPEGLSVAVNVAPAQFYTGSLVPAVAAALAASGLPGPRLELEITETALLRNGPEVLRQLAALKALGVKIALDDFGTGYSSLTQLRSFPFDRVKIDRSFADDGVVVRAVAALGTSLGMCVTAEGVETAEQMRRLRQDGCTEAQGYHLSRPVPVPALPGIIRRHLEASNVEESNR